LAAVILLGGSAGEIALRTQQLRDQAKISLLISADIEEEGVEQRFRGAAVDTAADGAGCRSL
jgi:beta-glucosidase